MTDAEQLAKLLDDYAKAERYTWNDASFKARKDIMALFEKMRAPAARYQWIAKQKHIWGVLGDAFELPERVKGATNLGESIDIAIVQEREDG